MKTTQQIHNLEVVEERINFYTNQIESFNNNNATDQQKETAGKLLNFWTKYKEKHFN